ncbi:hypothetical protein SNE40_001576 [Patella caerulea]|uniref:Reverse transcriptase domain-containing protein n=1 Tax=Patella caerulea TaxID=87958 RepID=A0AAN8Q8A7_PATCE
MLVLNVCGLKRKLLIPEFQEFIQEQDLLCLTETKLDDIDEIIVNDFSFIYKNRKKISGNRSGGIALGYRKSLSKFIHPITTDSQFVLWFYIDRSIIRLAQNIIIGIVYIPPENSSYTNEHAFSEIETEFQSITRNSPYVTLVGDFNSRTANLLDSYELDSNSLDEEFAEYREATNELKNLGIPIRRNSPDNCVNTFGRKLIKFCKNNNIFILNGRFDKDKVGRPTSRNLSVVDYVICSIDVIKVIDYFEILDHCKLFSDVHSPILFGVHTSDTIQHYRNTIPNKTNAPTERIRKWIPEKSTEFVTNLDTVKLEKISFNLSHERENWENISHFRINEIVNDISSLFVQSAKATFGVVNYNPIIYKNEKRQEKKWFTQDCRNKRRNYRRALRLYKLYGTKLFKSKLKQNEFVYKRAIKNSISIYNVKIQDEMKTLRSKDPKQFWKIINRRDREINTDISLDILFQYFENINASKQRESETELNINYSVNDTDNDILNKPISRSEIYKSIKNLKNNKSPGEDLIINEYISSTRDHMIEIYEYLFNLIFDTGMLPDVWLRGNIVPIFKNKGSKSDPENYRPITLLSTIGKLFTSILNSRLYQYLDELSILNENQAGFRAGYSTSDHIFSLYSLIELLKLKKRKLHCCFIDFEKCFDSIQRNYLYSKLLLNNINGKFYNIIQNMYLNIKSCIIHNNEKSNFFPCEIGVRQGENLSPILFSLFLNDLQEYLENKNITGIRIVTDDLESELEIYIKIFVLLYADDTILLADNPCDLQTLLTNFDQYCDKWNLKINIQKTKVLIFSSGIIAINQKFYLKNDEVEIVSYYKYLGVIFQRSRSFSKTKQDVIEKATKGMYSLLRKCRNNNLSISCQIQLFDKCILPILMYGSEIWGYENVDNLEKIQLNFYKTILNLRKTTPNCMIYAELGKLPIQCLIKMRMIQFWNRLLNGKASKLSFCLYKLLYINSSKYNFDCKWIYFLKTILNETGFPYTWNCQIVDNWTTKRIEISLKDQFLQKCLADIQLSPKCLCYKIFKNDFKLEPYFNNLTNINILILSRFRLGSHRLPIESGRWNKTPRNERLCHVCDSADIGDEFHYILKCKYFTIERKKLLPDWCQNRPNTFKFQRLFNYKNTVVLQKLCRFIKIIISKVNPP